MAFVNGGSALLKREQRNASCSRIRMSQGIGEFVANPEEKNEMTVNKNIKAGEKFSVCRCWQSSSMPLCDNSHQKHNRVTGDKLGPANVQAE
mmetsp:Transcript_37/g.106  ORF Transcript_37/g.106 Transcript_37/m.106 type:complete len:92 (+) Transcript_37:117-392(+)